MKEKQPRPRLKLQGREAAKAKNAATGSEREATEMQWALI
jgi:hypothetical protein